MIWGTAVVSVSAQSEIETFFSGLRERSLYAIAEDYAAARLEEESLLPDDRARLTVELAKTLVDHGALLTGSQRTELWQAAESRLTEFLQTGTNNPRIWEVRTEHALLSARRGDRIFWEYEVYPANRPAAEAARTSLLEARSRLQTILADWDQAPTKPTASQLADGALTSLELQLLHEQVRYQLARTEAQLAALSTGTERGSLLFDAVKRTEDLSKTRSNSPAIFEAKLLRCRLARLEGDERKAATLLRSLESNTSDLAQRDRVLAEQVRLEYAEGKLDSGLELITERIKQGPTIPDELRAVAVEGLLQAWQFAGRKGQTSLQQELLTEAEAHHQATRGKWHQLTAVRLREVQQQGDLGEELAALVRRAQAAYLSAEHAEARAGYGAAASLAHRQGQPEKAVEFAFIKGSLEIQQQLWDAAAETFEQILNQYPQQSRAGDAGLMFCYARGQLYQQAPARETRERYEASLARVRSLFAGSPAAVEATWMLAVHQEQRLQWTDALELYQQIPAGHPREDAAALRSVVMYGLILQRLREIDGPLAEWEDHLVQALVHIEDRFPDQPVLRSLEQCQTSLHAARLLLQHRDRWYRVADQWLQRVERTVDHQRREAELDRRALESDWKQLSRATAQLRIVSLAGQQKLGEAREILAELEQTDPSTMLGILLGLTELTSLVDPHRQVELGHLQLRAIHRLLDARDQLPEAQQRQLNHCHAEAQIAIGNLPEAAEIYEQLIALSPRNERVMRMLIDVLMQRGQGEDLVRARTWWSRIERLHPAGSAEWIGARLQIARLDSRLGKAAEARKLLGVTKTLYPELGTPELKAEIEATLADLENRSVQRDEG